MTRRYWRESTSRSRISVDLFSLLKVVPICVIDARRKQDDLRFWRLPKILDCGTLKRDTSWSTSCKLVKANVLFNVRREARRQDFLNEVENLDVDGPSLSTSKTSKSRSGDGKASNLTDDHSPCLDTSSRTLDPRSSLFRISSIRSTVRVRRRGSSRTCWWTVLSTWTACLRTLWWSFSLTVEIWRDRSASSFVRKRCTDIVRYCGCAEQFRVIINSDIS